MSLLNKITSFFKSKNEAILNPVEEVIEPITEPQPNIVHQLPEPTQENIIPVQEKIEQPQATIIEQLPEPKKENINPVQEVIEPSTTILSERELEEQVYQKIKAAFEESFRTGKSVQMDIPGTRSIAKKLMIDFPFLDLGLSPELKKELKKEIEEENQNISKSDKLTNEINALRGILGENAPKSTIEEVPEKNYDFDFVAIDFETANNEKHSICSVGVVGVKNGKIVEEKHWLVRPDPLNILPMNQSIHGIGFEDLKNASQFWEVWQELAPYIENQTIVAHNMPFDKALLIATLEHYAITVPKLSTYCTLELSKRHWKLQDYKLPTVAKFAGVKDLKHHDALSDARACARIYHEIQKEYQHHNFSIPQPKTHTISDKPKIKSSQTNNNVSFNKGLQKIKVEKSDNAINTNHPLFNKRIIITGELDFLTKDDAKIAIRNVGGKPMTAVSSLTDYLVLGTQKEQFGLNYISEKHQRAIDFGTKIIDELEFLKLLKNK